ncbi:MAG TPA: amino acid adenylation domain-containing protein [Ktedonobacteraceae bacterium]|jgi:amino acid adenylation domain-containing protein|nr:amino acid adenylation domain-containing protein [Ktedonobacteraceae bacterium]
MDLHAQNFSDQYIASAVQQGSQREQVIGDCLTYWKRRLEDAPPVLELPADHPRSSTRASRSAQYLFVLPQQLTASLKTVSQQNRVSVFITLLAAFNTLLFHYTGQDELLVGILSRRRELDGGVRDGEARNGFANLLILRPRLAGNLSFKELLKETDEAMSEVYEYGNVPFEQLVETLQVEQDSNLHPLCQIVFAFDECPAAENEAELSYVKNVPMLDLLLTIQDTEKGFQGNFCYNAGLFEKATITRIAGHWQRLLESIVDDPARHLSALTLLTEEERRQLIVEWNDTAVDYPKDKCIHQLFEAQVEHAPDAVAVVYEDAYLTYQQLNRRANQLAHYLQGLGVGPEVPVGICVERSLEMMVSLLGILKAGGAYVPLDPTYPPERLSFMLEDARAPVLLAQRHFKMDEIRREVKVVHLDEEWERISQESEENPVSGVTEEHAAYIIYTSGSTGTPKGVVIEHRSLVNYAHVAGAAYALKTTDRVLQFATLNFDASAEEIYTCLTRGATLVLRTASMVDSIPLFLEKCREWEITVLDLPTAYWHELTRKIVADGLVLHPALRLVIIGGEAALPELVVVWQKHVGSTVQLVNTYGPTETTIVATMYWVAESTEAGVAVQPVPIGRPIPNAQVYLLDRFLNVVPIGVPAELYIGGAGLARGYLNRPELTAQKFIPHPFSSSPGARLYKTGDLARFLPTGDIEFLGRIDHQVKIRGYRVELGEVEAVLRKHPYLQEALVLAREDVTGSKSLVAYVVPRHDVVLTGSDLRHFMREQLPDYMVPSAFVLLEALPLTPGGKVDRRALPAPDNGRSDLAEGFAVPTSPVHQQLVQIWEELLGVRPIGIRDNFFELGGHSLLAVRLVDRIEQVWGKKVSAATLLAGPTIEQLSMVLTQTDTSVPRTAQGSVDAKGPGRTSLLKSIFSGLAGRRGR